jgi:hypothetical protein
MYQTLRESIEDKCLKNYVSDYRWVTCFSCRTKTQSTWSLWICCLKGSVSWDGRLKRLEYYESHLPELKDEIRGSTAVYKTAPKPLWRYGQGAISKAMNSYKYTTYVVSKSNTTQWTVLDKNMMHWSRFSMTVKKLLYGRDVPWRCRVLRFWLDEKCSRAIWLVEKISSMPCDISQSYEICDTTVLRTFAPWYPIMSF